MSLEWNTNCLYLIILLTKVRNIWGKISFYLKDEVLDGLKESFRCPKQETETLLPIIFLSQQKILSQHGERRSSILTRFQAINQDLEVRCLKLKIFTYFKNTLFCIHPLFCLCKNIWCRGDKRGRQGGVCVSSSFILKWPPLPELKWTVN